MRLLAFFVVAFCCGCASTGVASDPVPDLPDTSSIERPDNSEASRMLDEFLLEMDKTMFLTGELNRLRARDSHVRRVFIETFRSPELDPKVREAFQDAGGAYMAQIDEANTKQLKELMSGMDWRTLASLGANLFDSAFLIVQHTSDFDYQEAVLAEIEPLAVEGLIDGQKFALMYDRVELRNNDSQLYGTQADCVDGQYDVIGLIDPENVDERRAQMGMEPLATYLDQLRELYGTC